MKIIVGRSDNKAAHVKWPDPSISFNHLEVTKIDKDTLWLKDLGSSNGTRVSQFHNGPLYDISETKFTRQQDIGLGHMILPGEVFFKKVRKHFIPAQVLWTKEFTEIEPYFAKYEKELDRISTNYQVKVNLFRAAGIGLIILFFVIFGEELGLDPNLKILATTIGGTLSIFAAPLFFPKTILKEKNRAVKKKYAKILQCPRCEKDLTNNTLKHYQEGKICEDCDAIWYR